MNTDFLHTSSLHMTAMQAGQDNSTTSLYTLHTFISRYAKEANK